MCAGFLFIVEAQYILLNVCVSRPLLIYKACIYSFLTQVSFYHYVLHYVLHYICFCLQKGLFTDLLTCNSISPWISLHLYILLLSATLISFLQIYPLMLTSMAWLNKSVHLFYNTTWRRSYLHKKTNLNALGV